VKIAVAARQHSRPAAMVADGLDVKHGEIIGSASVGGT
jgi:hypothetical protein